MAGGNAGLSYCQVIGDGQQTVTLAGALVDLVGRPLSTLWSKQSAASEYRAKLGEWADEAVDSKGRWLQPVLRATAFEDHLVREEGRFKPTGKCDSSFAWAQLLYALNIRPKNGVLVWRLPPKAIDPGKTGDIALAVDGSVMCHIINLYRVYREAFPVNFSPDSNQNSFPRDRGRMTTDACLFPFGRMKVERLGGDQFVARFDPGPQNDLAAERVPFSYVAMAIPGTHLGFERDSLMAKYFNAVHNRVPVTDNGSLGPLPPPNAALEVRTDYYKRGIRMLRCLHECTDKCEKSCPMDWDPSHRCGDECVKQCGRRNMVDWKRPRAVTRSWLAEIERIKRRVTTNGGDDDGLSTFIVKALEQRPEFVDKASKMLMYGVSMWSPMIRGMLRRRCLFTGKFMSVYWSARNKSPAVVDGWLVDLVMAELQGILAEKADERQDSWLAHLSRIVPELKVMLEETDEFENVPVMVLELGPEHELWSGVWEVSGE